MVGVAGFIIIFLFNINEAENIEIESIPMQSLAPAQNDSQNSPQWMQNFSKSEKLGFFYPVNEIFIEVDLNKEIRKETIYRLSANIKDPYQLFCLRQELKRYNLLYYLDKTSSAINLLIFSKNIEKLNSLIKSLKDYQIKASLEPYKEGTKWKNIK